MEAMVVKLQRWASKVELGSFDTFPILLFFWKPMKWKLMKQQLQPSKITSNLWPPTSGTTSLKWNMRFYGSGIHLKKTT
ncbi:hypothetical protein WA026_021499 [Henosepilachna vigintioctopunctata]|uniref:Uncharacterized protein n=1 Tax=Henosepilachna vigintioctopunctata TaxID=420089 RepID=A0AAW1UN23_9CUCU